MLCMFKLNVYIKNLVPIRQFFNYYSCLYSIPKEVPSFGHGRGFYSFFYTYYDD